MYSISYSMFNTVKLKNNLKNNVKMQGKKISFIFSFAFWGEMFFTHKQREMKTTHIHNLLVLNALK